MFYSSFPPSVNNMGLHVPSKKKKRFHDVPFITLILQFLLAALKCKYNIFLTVLWAPAQSNMREASVTLWRWSKQSKQMTLLRGTTSASEPYAAVAHPVSSSRKTDGAANIGENTCERYMLMYFHSKTYIMCHFTLCAVLQVAFNWLQLV